jgi:hypothetical protein
MPYSEWIRIINASVTPVVIISACGLLCLAFYNRLTAIVSRLREFQRERLGEQEILSRMEPQTAPEIIRRRKMLEELEAQTTLVMRRAKLIQRTLFFLLTAIALLIGCCAMLGFSIVEPGAVLLAVPFFLLGLLSVLAAMFTALTELKSALQPAELESRCVSEILQQSPSRWREAA